MKTFIFGAGASIPFFDPLLNTSYLTGKVDVVLPQQSNYYGERCRFLHGYNESVHEESISQTAAINPSDARKRRVVPLGQA